MAGSYVSLGSHVQAIAVVQQRLIDNPKEPFLFGVRHIYGQIGQRAKAAAEIMAAFALVWAHAGVGDRYHDLVRRMNVPANVASR